MKLEPYEIEELCELAWGYQEGTLRREQSARLEELVLRDHTTQSLFVQWSAMAADLQFQHGSRKVEEILREAMAGQEGPSAGDKRATGSPPLIGNVSAWQERSKRPPLFSRPISFRLGAPAFTAAILFLVAATGGWWLVSRSSDGPPQFTHGRPVTGASADSASQLPVITSFHSKAKSTTLRLEGIGFVTIEGPTDFSLIGPKRARLNYGRIKVRVTEKSGQGFVIETPDGEVTDLGTEFALNVSQGSDSSLIVHEGKVDLRVGSARQLNGPERLVGGEAVSFNATGDMRRLMSVVASDSDATEEQVEQNGAIDSPLILSVSDNLPTSDTKGYYQIVPRGLREDALSNVDGRHEWNGVDANGIPAYLVNADYVKTFADQKSKMLRKTNVSVSLSRPAKLYVFWCDERESPHEWLLRDFQPTGDQIGLDAEWQPKSNGDQRLCKGPGKSIDMKFSIWVREVTAPGTVVLGTGVDPSKSGTYNIAAVELSAPDVSATP